MSSVTIKMAISASEAPKWLFLTILTKNSQIHGTRKPNSPLARPAAASWETTTYSDGFVSSQSV